MISTKDLSGLPNAERLKNFCKELAALDIIMVEEEWSFIRHYTYNPAWRKGKEAFFATDGSDQSMIVMFAPEGCVINGVDSELYDWEEKLPRIEDLTDGMPSALQKLMSSREVKKMKSTFCAALNCTRSMNLMKSALRSSGSASSGRPTLFPTRSVWLSTRRRGQLSKRGTSSLT